MRKAYAHVPSETRHPRHFKARARYTKPTIDHTGHMSYSVVMSESTTVTRKAARFTPTELALISEAADLSGCSNAQFIRTGALREATRVVVRNSKPISEDTRAARHQGLIDELTKIGMVAAMRGTHPRGPE